MSEIRVDNITDEEGTGSPNIIYDNAASGLTATSIKGAIDEVSGGAIVESDSNSNGSYVRWESGVQLCLPVFVIDDLSEEINETINLPADFIDENYSFGNMALVARNEIRGDGSATLDYLVLAFCAYKDVLSSSSVIIRERNITDNWGNPTSRNRSDAGDVKFVATAWGFWK